MDQFLGLVMPMGFNFAPVGWAPCNGALLSIAENTALFSLLGTTYGGDGQNTFALPDLRGRIIVGVGEGPGLDNIEWGQAAGTNAATMLISQMPTHTHAVMAKGNALSSNSNDPNQNYFGGGNAAIYDSDWDNSTIMHAGSMVGANTGGNIPINITNPYLAIYYNIATEGIYPSRN